MSSAVRDGEQVAIPTWLRLSCSELLANAQMLGVCILGATLPGIRGPSEPPNALISGRRSSTAKNKTFFAPAGAGTGGGAGHGLGGT